MRVKTTPNKPPGAHNFRCVPSCGTCLFAHIDFETLWCTVEAESGKLLPDWPTLEFVRSRAVGLGMICDRYQPVFEPQE